MADIKKIAQKFVSEDLADKLAHSIVQVIHNINKKGGGIISDEISKFDNPNQKVKHENIRSEMDNRHRVDQQRFKKETRTPEVEHTSNDNRDDTKIINNKNNNPQAITKKYPLNWELNLKAQDANKYTITEEIIKPENEDMKLIFQQQNPIQHNNIKTRTTKLPIRYTIRTTRHQYPRYDSSEIQARNGPVFKPISGPEMMEINKKSFDNDAFLDLKRHEERDDFKLTAANNDDQNSNKNIRQSNENPELYNQETQKATTRREKIEFDQYDNLNYSKGNYIATSGPVALPAPTTVDKKWWEKEFTNRRKL